VEAGASAPAAARRLIPPHRLRIIAPSARRADDQRLALDPVPEIASRVPDRCIGLHVVLCVSGSHGDHVLAGARRLPGVLPGSEGIRAMIRAERCLEPAPAVVLRELHLHDGAVTTERDALNA